MRIGSLFSGIGGLELGLERAGVGVVSWQVEIDEFCSKVLAKHWPTVERYSNVKEVGKKRLSPVDLICGGFPCQDVSSAGKRAGLGGERSGLWREFRRIVEELQPTYVVVENVASGKRLWLPSVRQDLHMLGYDTTAYAISAADVGAPHVRKRIFVVARTTNANGSRWQRGDRSKLAIGIAGERYAGHANGSRESDGTLNEKVAILRSVATNSRPWGSPPVVRRVDDGISRGMDKRRIRSLGNAVVPQCAEVVGRIVVEMELRLSVAA